MHALVTIQGGRVVEALVTDRALVRLFSCMNSDVPPQLSVFHKASTANVTLEGTLPGVPSHVNDQRRFSREAFLALRALKWFLTVVGILV